jgi:hypothetical protein
MSISDFEIKNAKTSAEPYRLRDDEGLYPKLPENYSVEDSKKSVITSNEMIKRYRQEENNAIIIALILRTYP